MDFLQKRDGRTDRPMDRRTDGPTDGRTHPLLQMRGRIEKRKVNLSRDLIVDHIGLAPLSLKLDKIQLLGVSGTAAATSLSYSSRQPDQPTSPSNGETA